MPRLIVLAKNSSVKQINITGAVTTIGRADTNKVCVPSDRVSRQHAAIERTGGGFMLTDMGSRNGTYVNNERVRVRKLANGDLIDIGDCQLRFLYHAAELPQADGMHMLTVRDDLAAFEAMARRRPAFSGLSLLR